MKMLLRPFSMILFFTPIFSSCQIYGNKFDCPPGEGVPCISVTDIENRIIESNDGADVFVSSGTIYKKTCSCKKACNCKRKEEGRIIWMADDFDAIRKACEPFEITHLDSRGDME